jgi:hypothetical protein
VVISGSIALAGLVGVVAALGYLHLAPTGLSPVRNAVSQYGITSYALGYRIATIAFALSGAALAISISRISDLSSGSVVVFLVVFAGARSAISWYPMDAPGSARTQSGRTHGILAIVAFGAVTAAAFGLGRDLSVQTSHAALATTSSTLGWAMLAALLVMVAARSNAAVRAKFGLIERCFYLAAIAWFAVIAAGCVTNAL